MKWESLFFRIYPCFVDFPLFPVQFRCMPITGPASFLPTTNEFLAHWATANDALGVSGPLVLKGGVALGDLEDLRDLLQGQRAAVEVALNGREEARADLEGKKALLLLWLNRFNTKLEAVAEDPKWLAMRPEAFSQGDGMGKVVPPLDDAADIWSRYDAVADSGLAIIGGTGIADFNTALGELKDLYADYAVKDNGVSMARAKRNETQELIRAVLLNYRKRIEAEFEEGSPVLETLPRYTPLPGHTPEPVSASGAFNAGSGQAELSWTESTDTKLTEYEVRGVAADYDAEDESVIANIAAGAVRTWTGSFGLGVPGAQASFRVYVMTSTGNERASNTVSLERPAEVE